MSIMGKGYIKVILRLLPKYKDIIKPEKKPNLNALRYAPYSMLCA